MSYTQTLLSTLPLVTMDWVIVISLSPQDESTTYSSMIPLTVLARKQAAKGLIEGILSNHFCSGVSSSVKKDLSS